MNERKRRQFPCHSVRLRAVAAIILACTLAAPVTGACAMENLIGIFSDTTNFVTQVNPPLFVPFNVYFMLLSPRTAGGEAVTAVDGFEYRVLLVGQGAVWRLSDTLPTGWFNLRDASDSDNASYMAGGATPVPVVGDLVELQSWTIMAQSMDQTDFHLQPVHLPTLAGTISFTYPGASGSVSVAALPTSQDLRYPVFCLNCFMIDPVDKQTFGEIKALYR